MVEVCEVEESKEKGRATLGLTAKSAISILDQQHPYQEFQGYLNPNLNLDLSMPKQGPKKFTRRDEKDHDRRLAKQRQQSATDKAINCEKAIKEYNEQHNPNIPSSKGERRALKSALAAEGISLERWNGGPIDQRFAHIAQERFVNNKYAPIPDEVGDFESDPWLQMFMHLPVDYRETVAEPVLHMEEPAPASPSKQDRPQRQKMSRRQAQALRQAQSNPAPEEGMGATDEEVFSLGSASYDAVEDAFSDHKSERSVPTGQVVILNSKGVPLTTELNGRPVWKNTAEQDGEQWTIAPGRNGKYTLRSPRGKYLSHCLMWGFVADRTAADTWEEFQLIPAHFASSDKCDHKDNMYHLLSWRGSYLSCTADGSAEAKNQAQEQETIKIVPK